MPFVLFVSIIENDERNNMKNLFFVLLCCVCVHSVCAGVCTEESIDKQSIDEAFLYESEFNYIIGKGYLCDDNICNDGTTITMFPGHLWKGEQINEITTYKCTNNKWELLSNDNSGEFVANIWCNSWTKSGETFVVSADSDEDMFQEIKMLLENENENNQYAMEIILYCTDDGWSNAHKVTKCAVPYVANNEGFCEHYTTFLDSLYDSQDEGHQATVTGSWLAAVVVYAKYRKGKLDEEQTKLFMSKDPELQGRFSD